MTNVDERGPSLVWVLPILSEGLAQPQNDSPTLPPLVRQNLGRLLRDYWVLTMLQDGECQANVVGMASVHV